MECVGCGIQQLQAQRHIPPPPEAVYSWGATCHLPDLLFSLLTAVTEPQCLLSWVCGRSEFPHGRGSELGSFKVITVPVSLRKPQGDLNEIVVPQSFLIIGVICLVAGLL